ncbi:MAG: hypothetical protein WC479_03115 [Candidatus Izemoplasmatales bacterium]
MKFIYKLVAIGLFLWAFQRNTFDVQEVLVIIGAIGWLTMGEQK